MFYILVILGTIFIALGGFLEKKQIGFKKNDLFIDEIYNDISKEHKSNKASEKSDTQLLEKRIDILEEMLFKKTLEEKIGQPMLLEDQKEETEEDSLEKHKLIKKYEKQNKSLDQIAKLLNINKGEVLLLKSLYKNL